MTTTEIMDEVREDTHSKPGARLASMRQQKNYNVEYVAEKLHLRVRIVELIEADDYENLPEPVFIKGYLRAYAKLLGMSVQPLLDAFNSIHKIERAPVEKALWQQSKREPHKAEHAIRWLTGFFAVVVIAAVAMWWYANKDNERLFPTATSHIDASNKSESEIRLTDLSKMRSLLSSTPQTDTNSTPEQ